MLQPGLPAQEKANELRSIADNDNAGYLGRNPDRHGGSHRIDTGESGRQNEFENIVKRKKSWNKARI
jgi:hypothetical protein